MSSVRELAKALGVSAATVSRALDGHPNVSTETRARIVAAAKAANYRPNSAARRLSTGRSEIVSLVLPTEAGHFDEPLYIRLLHGIGRRLAAAGYDLSVLSASPGAEEDALYRRLVESRRADGVIVVRTRWDDPRVTYLQSVDFPFVCMGRTNARQPYAFVDGDGEAAFADATRRILALGHRSLVHLAAPSAFCFSRYRRTGFARAMDEAGLEPRVCEIPADGHAACAMAHALLDGRDPPTAIVAATDRMAYGVLKCCAERGLVPGRDLSVIGHDNLTASAFTSPPLTTMELSFEATAEQLASFMLARIDGEDPAALQAVQPVAFLQGGTLAARRSAGAPDRPHDFEPTQRS
ncbi:MAG: substrate-binding domain-containing protein [Alsobacter sp.]